MSDEFKKVDEIVGMSSMNPDKEMTDVKLFELLIKSTNLIDKCQKFATSDKSLREDCLNALSLFKERVLKDDEYTLEEKEKFSYMLENLSLYCTQKASDDILSQILNILKKGSECLEVIEVIETIFYSVLPQVNDLEKITFPISKDVEKLIDCLVDEISISKSSLNTSAEETCTTHEITLTPASPKELKVEMKELTYRDPESWTDDESISSSSSGSVFSLEELKKSSPVKIKPLKTKGEIGIEDLPPVEDLTISVKEEELTKVGKIHGIVGKLVVIQAGRDEASRPLNSDSVLFLSPHKPLGRIFEVFGPVSLPFYTVLFNTVDDIKNKGIEIGCDVYYCPQIRDMTTYVFVDDLRKQKGSDASWMDNNEPPDEFLDYSDDEQERAAKLKRRAKNRTRNDEKEEEDDIQIISNKVSCVDRKILGTNNADNYQNKNYFQRKGNFSQSSVNNHSSEITRKNLFSFSDCKPISNRSSPARSTQSLEDVPVWISSPPTSFLANDPQPVQTQHNNSPCPMPSFQPSFSQPQFVHPSLSQPPYVHPSSTQPQYFQAPSSQAYPINVPISQSSLHYPVNINQQVMSQHQFSRDNFIPPPRPPQQQLMQPNIPRPFNNVHTFGEITPISAVSPMPPNPIFRPSPVILVAPPNQVIPTSMISSTPPPVMSPNPYWQQRNHLRSPLVHVQSPPQNALNMQNPVFPNMPPPLRFTSMYNFPMNQPRHTHPTNFSFSEPTYRF